MKKAIIFVLILFSLVTFFGCKETEQKPKFTSGVTKKSVGVKTDSKGWTVEQNNIAARLKRDNQPGAIKHLYVISAYSGDVLVYSAVKGKVTSSGKRLTPYHVAAIDGQYVGSDLMGMRINIGGKNYRTPEVLQDDGTYGSSIPYLFWEDTKGNFHQHYVSGGQIIHISDVPLRVKKPIINVELYKEEP